MTNEKPFDLDEIGKLDDVARGVFVQPPCPERRHQDDELMRKFIEKRKLKNKVEA